MKPDTSVKIGRLKLKNPVMVASGTFGEEYRELADIRSLGAVVAKTITLKARSGNRPPRLVETPSGMLNSIGLENKGLDFFVKETLPALTRFKAPVIASISGDSEDEFAALARALQKRKGLSALELNLSCPNVKHGSSEGLIAQDAEATGKIVSEVRRATQLPLIAKLSPNVTDITRIAVAAQDAGADAITLINTLFGMSVDIETRRPRLGNVHGGLSGPAIKPVALKIVWDAHKKVKIPIIGAGGIMGHKDAIEFILCGASAVQVGTANFVDPRSAVGAIEGIKEYLVKNKIKSVSQLVGRLET
ncbi:MAG: dihydroorotate dehydrogenase [Candidatus Omnitrophica bacterium]|nr:dihydroorotate dehydrogenase [Candidatus Omnitrophota bacterium]